MEFIDPFKVPYYIFGGKRHHENRIFQDIDQRLTLIEEKLFKKVKRLRATEAQRFLIAYHQGQIRPITELNNLQQKQKDLIVSVMLDIDPTNAKKFLAELSKAEKPLLHTAANYKFLIEFFQQAGLKDKEEEAEAILTKIETEKEQIGQLRKSKRA